ncbi:MAG: phosphatidate cytidylyltransferase, partial [Desulfobulbaceae bacterium]|nr:phosphatidate cytidylyltransferase [Desulfobulbaceae bacterium]
MKRLITGLLVCAGWLSLVLFSGVSLFWLVVSAIGVIALHEYATMVLGDFSRSFRLEAIFCGLLPFLAAFSGKVEAVAAVLPLAFFVLVGFVIFRYRDLADPFKFLSRSGLGILYVGFCGAHLILLRHEPAGMSWLLWLTGITVGSDSFAYYVGRLLGKRKLCSA